MKKNDLKSFPDYKNPPVIEVVCGISFEKLEKFKGHHIGLIWQKVQDEFPNVENAIRLEIDPSVIDLANYFPRIWFVSRGQNKLIQIQDDKYYFNWRRIQEDETYPHYDIIIKMFKNYLSLFEKFIKEESIGVIKPLKCELSYINHIPKGEGWESLSEINNVFRDLLWNGGNRFLPPPVSLSGQAIFSLPDKKGNLSLVLQQAKSKTDQNPIFVLRNTASGLGEDKSMESVWEWFEVAHEWIVCGFSDLTGEKTQKDIWRRIDIG